MPIFSGSAAREEQNSLSDIDIAVYLREDCDPAEAKLDLIGKFMERLGRGRFDLVILNTAPLPLAARVIRCRKVLAERDPFPGIGTNHAFSGNTSIFPSWKSPS